MVEGRDKRKAFRHGGNYYAVTLPKEWVDHLKKASNMKELTALWGNGYVLYVEPSVVTERWSEGRTEEIRTEVQKRLLKGLKNPDVGVMLGVLKVQMAAHMLAGYESFEIICEDKWELDKAEELLSTMEINSTISNQRILKHEPPDKESRIILASIDSELESKINYEMITEHLFRNHNELVGQAISCLENRFSEKSIHEIRHLEAMLDFWWVFGERYTSRSISRGVHCGSNLTGKHAVAFSLLYKALERNADHICKLLVLLRCSLEEKENKTELEALGQLCIQVLKKSREQYNTIKDSIITAISKMLTNDEVCKLTQIVIDYEQNWKDKLGYTYGDYLDALEKTSKIMEHFGQRGAELLGNTLSKNAILIFGSAWPELQYILRQSRNMAMLTIALAKK